MEIENLRSEMAAWPVQWRWEGVSGHPRRMTDVFVRALEDQGFTVDLADVPLSWGQARNVGEFEGAIIARWRQSSGEALRRKWAAAAVGVVLAPVIVGIFMIKYALEGRRHQVGLEWRGESYPATARADKDGFGAERTGIVSDVRVTLRGAISDANRLVRDLSDMQPSLNRIQWALEGILPTLTMPAGTAQPEGAAGAVEEAFTPASPALDATEKPPSLGEGRADA